MESVGYVPTENIRITIFPLLLLQLVYMASCKWWVYDSNAQDLPREQIVAKVVEKVMVLSLLHTYINQQNREMGTTITKTKYKIKYIHKIIK